LTDIDLILRRLLPDPDSFSNETWARRLEEFEGRAILFAGIRLPPSYFGGRVIVTEETEGANGTLYPAAEYILYEQRLPSVHREHIKTHELAHMALGHSTLVVSPTELEKLFTEEQIATRFPNLCCRASSPSRSAESYLVRDGEAERLTRLIYQRVLLTRQQQRVRRHSSHQDLDRELRRLGLD
jgi:hypothetical protein